ncbi:hypothetical protein EDF58_1241, partial [Novosphingobium sp. PhB57]
AAAHLQSFNLGRGDLNHLNGLKGSSFFRRLLNGWKYTANASVILLREA